MIETELTKLALDIAEQAHEGQVDKSGKPYILHPIHVAEKQKDEVSTAVALLHDVVEDSDWTFEDLLEAGIPEEVVHSLRYMTHEKYTPYMEYIENLAQDPVACRVKLADLEHNMDTSRMNRELTEREQKKQEKYAAAHEYLESFLPDRCD